MVWWETLYPLFLHRWKKAFNTLYLPEWRDIVKNCSVQRLLYIAAEVVRNMGVFYRTRCVLQCKYCSLMLLPHSKIMHQHTLLNKLKWFQGQQDKFKCLSWPPQLPDLNYIKTFMGGAESRGQSIHPPSSLIRQLEVFLLLECKMWSFTLRYSLVFFPTMCKCILKT